MRGRVQRVHPQLPAPAHANAAAPPPGSLDSSENDYSGENHPMVVMGAYFVRYLSARLTDPRLRGCNLPFGRNDCG